MDRLQEVAVVQPNVAARNQRPPTLFQILEQRFIACWTFIWYTINWLITLFRITWFGQLNNAGWFIIRHHEPRRICAPEDESEPDIVLCYVTRKEQASDSDQLQKLAEQNEKRSTFLKKLSELYGFQWKPGGELVKSGKNVSFIKIYAKDEDLLKWVQRRNLATSENSLQLSPAERDAILIDILNKTPYTETANGPTGIKDLCKEKVFKHSYLPQKRSDRRKLHENLGHTPLTAPIEDIRKHRGDEHAMLNDVRKYFCWFVLVVFSITIPANWGYGLFTFKDNLQVKDTCDRLAQEPVCPACSSCTFTKVGDRCNNAKMIHFADTDMAVCIQFIVVVCSIVFPQIWEIHQGKRSKEQIIQEYEGERSGRSTNVENSESNKSCLTVRNKLVIAKNWLFSFVLCRHLIAFFIVLLLLIVTTGFITGIALLQNYFHSWTNRQMFSTKRRFWVSNVASAVGGLLNAAAIWVTGLAYRPVAKKLAKFESPELKEASLKNCCVYIFTFDFMTFCWPIFYFAFVKGNITVKPLQPFLPYFRFENCDVTGCIYEFAIHILFTYGCSRTWKLLLFMRKRGQLVPLLTKSKLQKTNKKRINNNKSLVSNYMEGYFQNAVDKNYFTNEYTTIAIDLFCVVTCGSITAGFITALVIIFQVATYCIHNHYLDNHYRKRKPKTVKDIGAFMPILYSVCILAIIASGLMIAFTSDFVPRLVFKRYDGNPTLDGYLNSTLAYSDISGFSAPEVATLRMELQAKNISYCRYPGYRKPPCCLSISSECDDSKSLSKEFWVILSFRAIAAMTITAGAFLLQFIVKQMISKHSRDVQSRKKKHK